MNTFPETLEAVERLNRAIAAAAPALADTHAVRGKGCRVWDDHGREFIDFRNAMGPVTLGYCYPAVDEAITAQLRRGIVFGHPHPLGIANGMPLSAYVGRRELMQTFKRGVV